MDVSPSPIKVQCLYAHCGGDADFLKAHSTHGAISSFMEACSHILESVSALVIGLFSSVAECMGGDKIINVKGEQWLSFSMDKPKVLLSVLKQFCFGNKQPNSRSLPDTRTGWPGECRLDSAEESGYDARSDGCLASSRR